MTDATRQWNKELVKVVDLETARLVIPGRISLGASFCFP